MDTQQSFSEKRAKDFSEKGQHKSHPSSPPAATPCQFELMQFEIYRSISLITQYGPGGGPYHDERLLRSPCLLFKSTPGHIACYRWSTMCAKINVHQLPDGGKTTACEQSGWEEHTRVYTTTGFMLWILQVDKLTVSGGKTLDAANCCQHGSIIMRLKKVLAHMMPPSETELQSVVVTHQCASAGVMLTHSKRWELTREVKSFVMCYNDPSFTTGVVF